MERDKMFESFGEFANQKNEQMNAPLKMRMMEETPSEEIEGLSEELETPKIILQGVENAVKKFARKYETRQGDYPNLEALTYSWGINPEGDKDGGIHIEFGFDKEEADDMERAHEAVVQNISSKIASSLGNEAVKTTYPDSSDHTSGMNVVHLRIDARELIF